MLDVHAPHSSIGGWREFLLHLVAITIGLVIALSLEGLVEWREDVRVLVDRSGSRYSAL